MTDDIKMKMILDLSKRVDKIEKEINNSKREELDLALNQFRYMRKTSDQREALMIIEKELQKINQLSDENEQLKQQIKDLRLKVLDSIHEANDIQCSCNPCVVEECVKKVVE